MRGPYAPTHIPIGCAGAGPGFAPAFVDHAFESFSRGDSSRAGGGSGLGLAIVEVIARAHGGAAHAANVDGGVDVWLEVPDAQRGSEVR